LRFDLDPETTQVTAQLKLRRDPVAAPDAELVLAGRNLTLLALRRDGLTLTAGVDYHLSEAELRLSAPDAAFTLEIVTAIHPVANTALEGLYLSGEMLCTQCEPEGFRRMTYYLDRPDVLTRFSVELHADKLRYPVLLSNGNRVGVGVTPDGQHWARWEDPFPKPSYLFALVAGDLVCSAERYTTLSGRQVALEVYVDAHNHERCAHALTSLRRAMQWDEQTFGREYDLDSYMIVAAEAFNMGAMENKGLNLFNAKYALASPTTATDADYYAIESVIAHEYFHNWTGNRITLRDWFQLSLKEGLTIYRDQEFTADLHDRGVKRIEDVRSLRGVQFLEDAGPMAHPVRPDSYIEINNFYTATVYNKGAELIRVLRNLIGRPAFAQGMALYFARYDGLAVTIEDLLAVMAEASGHDLSAFQRWYTQSGTPQVQVQNRYDAATQTLTLEATQLWPDTPGQVAADKLPVPIPLRLALFSRTGQMLGAEQTLWLTAATQRYVLPDVLQPPVLSLLRDFSAPVKLDQNVTCADLRVLLAHDTDPFNRWEAGQRLASEATLNLVRGQRDGCEQVFDNSLIEGYAACLQDATLTPLYLSQLLALPSETYLGSLLAVGDPVAVHSAREAVIWLLAAALREPLLACYTLHTETVAYRFDAASMGKRSLRNLCLDYLLRLYDPNLRQLALRQFQQASNMTDQLAALQALASCEGTERETALAAFYTRWAGDNLVIDKWFAVQAASRLPGALARVQQLMAHPAFTQKNPNRVRALVGTFCSVNLAQFHADSGAGYEFLAAQIRVLDTLNPLTAARMLTPLTRWRQFDPNRQTLMRSQLEQLLAVPGLSKDVYEVVSKSLA
jgi:aminopeptidase N